MSQLHVKTSDCSHDELVRIAQRCGFHIVEGRKHSKVKTRDNRFVTTIPRKSQLKRETARGIVEAMNGHGAGITYT